MKTRGNTILITGGTSGIGRPGPEVPRARQPGDVAGRRTQLLDEIAAGYLGIETIALDIADPESIAAPARRWWPAIRSSTS